MKKTASSFYLAVFLLIFAFGFIGCRSSSDTDFFDPNEGEMDSVDEEMEMADPDPDPIVPVPTPALPLSNNPPCESLEFGDGRGGDLWLPESESNGLPVYILNNGWQDPATVDAVLVGGGLERANFTGFANPDAGILRPHFRFSRGCRSYTGTFIINDSSQSCEVTLPADVCSRID